MGRVKPVIVGRAARAFHQSSTTLHASRYNADGRRADDDTETGSFRHWAEATTARCGTESGEAPFATLLPGRVPFSDSTLPTNGDFELGPKSSDLNGTVVLSSDDILEWEISGFVEYIPFGHKQGDMLLVVPEGTFAVRLDNDDFIRKKILLTAGLRYSLTFSVTRTCAQSERLNIYVTPYFGTLPIQTTYNSSGRDSYAWAFLAKVVVVDLVIHNPDVEEDPACGPVIDVVAIRTLWPPRPTNTNLLKNVGFEESPFFLPNTSWDVIIPPNNEDDS
ncbi:hypothetical protein KSP40_PGU011058 [Platanthera guangdongensis]|uniref:DUF642 domain-containing protein n=1 Tax=Platanthera guangdongensis TaxID=2320717 RepID=A0ABR2LN65_9ASPA